MHHLFFDDTKRSLALASLHSAAQTQLHRLELGQLNSPELQAKFQQLILDMVKKSPQSSPSCLRLRIYIDSVIGKIELEKVPGSSKTRPTNMTTSNEPYVFLEFVPSDKPERELRSDALGLTQRQSPQAEQKPPVSDDEVESETPDAVPRSVGSLNPPSDEAIRAWKAHRYASWTQQQIADEIGKSQGHVSRMISQVDEYMRRTGTSLQKPLAPGSTRIRATDPRILDSLQGEDVGVPEADE